MKIIATAILLTLMLPGAAIAQEDPAKDKDRREEKRGETLDKAGRIATQPGRDVGLDKQEIPEVLQRAVEYPYAKPSGRTCKALNTDLAGLNAVLGDDFVVGREANEDRTGKIAEAVGKTVINSLIPFRGLVREISGAAPAERRLQGAVSAGIARRGYLRGLASARGCKITA